jgi:PTH2 family peptidyl-tRNA hydrolase
MKQAIVVRSDLKMGRGKMAAQVAHASLSAAEETMDKRSDWFGEWKEEGQAKIILKIKTEEALRDLYKKAKAAKLPAALIEDRGLTQLEPGTVTCLGIGPGPEVELDKITGKLKLL